MDFKQPEEGAIKKRYETLKETRSSFLDRAYKYSKITLPYLLPENDDVSASEMQIDYGSVGAEYVNHLSNVYVDEMFPAHRSFFKLQMPFEDLQAASDAAGKDVTKVQAGFARAEKEARWKFEQRQARGAALDFMKQLIVTGNSMLYLPPDGFAQTYALDQYVVWRDVSGKLLEVITEDNKSLLSLEDDLKAKVMSTLDDITDETDLAKKTVKIYTWIRRNPDNAEEFLVNQAVESINIGEQDTYKENLLPWIPCYWNRTRREVYGRGLIEDHYGAFYALGILVEALVTAGAIMTDFKFLVAPGSVLDVVEMNSAASGTYHYGNRDDVTAIETGKSNDLQFVAQLIDGYRKQLGKIFLVLSSQLRDAERVTAEENRLRAQELNKAHGGVFGNLSITLQRPMAELLLRDIKVLIDGSGIEPVVMTGLDAMGRTSENEKILYFFSDLTALQNVPEPFQQRLKISETMTILATGRDIETAIIMTDAEADDAAQAAQEAQMNEVAGQEMLKKAEPGQIAQGMQQEG